jgi:DNA-binding transcriptional regulator/RsmH inhibitor MraZ
MSALIPGEIAKVDKKGRLAIPVRVLKAVSWWAGRSGHVTSELTRKGLIRIFPDSAMAAALRNVEPDASDSEADYIARAVIADRYRELALYEEGRLYLTKEICPWLGFRLGEVGELFAQPFHYGIEVMSMEHRFGRLTNAQDDVLPWTFDPPK